MMESFGVLEACNHGKCNLGKAFTYCSLLAVAYVGSLYVFVPGSVRKLSRDDPKHIKYRGLACLIVCALAILTYPSIFCAPETSSDHAPLFSVTSVMLLPPLDRVSLKDLIGPLLHTCILYLAPSIASLLYMYEFQRRSTTPLSMLQVIQGRLGDLKPQGEQEFWMTMRNYVIAPWTEEIIFRGCMIPALLATGMSPTRVALVAPVFFGIAHVHHAVQKLADGEPPKRVLFMTLFHFVYTSLFGSYASHAFIRVGSVLSVTLSHSYCNCMGLPDFGFANSRHPLHAYRRILFVAYIVGIGGFWYLFKVDLLLPLPSKLPEVILVNAGD